jgi:hypothetical protein
LYWEPETDLLDRKREDLFAAVRDGNVFLTSRQKAERQREGTPFYATAELADRHLTRPGSMCFPLFAPKKATQSLFDGEEPQPDNGSRRPNLAEGAVRYLHGLSVDVATVEGAGLLWMHTLAIGHSPEYLRENAGALWQDFPRIPLPATREALEASAALGRRVAGLLDVQQAVPGVTTGKIGAELKTIGLITHVKGKQINDADDLAVTAGWGNPGRGGITMPAGGKSVPRDFAPEELFALCGEPEPVEENDTITRLGGTTFDIYLNDRVYWRNIPAAVWEYTLGGYQVIKKWLSYRESKILARPLRADEARYVTEMSRRIAAILLLHADLDENYRKVLSPKFVVAP